MAGGFAPKENATDWSSGASTTKKTTGTGSAKKATVETKTVPTSSLADNANARSSPSYQRIDQKSALDSTYANRTKLNGRINAATYKTSWQKPDVKKEMLDENKELIQNGYGFPYYSAPSNGNMAAKYDYQIIAGDPRYKSGPLGDFETRMMRARAAFGIPVHGNNDIARAMKFYMYNRWKIPDRNLAYNRTFTHVFFTRPDLNLLDNKGNPVGQIQNHTESALMWLKDPEIFKLLSDANRIGDADNNFNFLLSNQITNFSFPEEELGVVTHGTSWNDQTMQYGQNYKGRSAGTFSCTFDETSELSVINYIKMWITYIDNVSRGAWHPSYDDGWSPVWERALDYAASVYVFKVAEDGERILFWTKYYGIFPINTGVSALNWDKSTPAGGESPRLSISFAYSYKKDLSPISLVEFNSAARVSGNIGWIPNFNVSIGHSARPYVGKPFVEFNLGSPDPKKSYNDALRGQKRTELRLKFQPDPNSADMRSRADNIIFKANSTSGDASKRMSSSELSYQAEDIGGN